MHYMEQIGGFVLEHPFGVWGFLLVFILCWGLLKYIQTPFSCPDCKDREGMIIVSPKIQRCLNCGGEHQFLGAKWGWVWEPGHEGFDPSDSDLENWEGWS